MKKRNKYGAKKITIQGVTFDSIAEGMRFLELQQKQLRGQISGLQLQVPFPVLLIPGQCADPVPMGAKNVCKYYADFVYLKDGEQVVEDVKGRATEAYRIKKKLVQIGHGITITEVQPPTIRRRKRR